MSAHSTDPQLSLFASCALASPAKTSAPQTQAAPASTEPAPACSSNVRESLARSAPSGSLSKTSHDWFGGAWIALSANSEPSVTRWKGRGSALGMWEPPTDGNACSSSADWPTPNKGGGSNRGGAAGRVGKLRPQLAGMAKKWPTPTKRGRKGLSPTSGDGLATATKQWPAPTRRDWNSHSAAGGGDAGPGRPLSEHQTGPLNPEWVECLMGWPIGWTALAGPSLLDQSNIDGSPREP